MLVLSVRMHLGVTRECGTSACNRRSAASRVMVYWIYPIRLTELRLGSIGLDKASIGNPADPQWPPPPGRDVTAIHHYIRHGLL